MNAFKRLWFDFTHPKEWQIYLAISHCIWKIKDYDRIAYDYGCVLDHATCGRMSKTNYDLKTIYSVIDNAQKDMHYEIIKSDLMGMIDNGADINEIWQYALDLGEPF